MSVTILSSEGSPPSGGACSESRGSSVSSSMREEYEDLLRYAVVMPVADFDAKKAFKQQAAASSSRTGGVVVTKSGSSLSTRVHATGGGEAVERPRTPPIPEPTPVSARYKSLPPPPFSPLHPEVKIVESICSSVSNVSEDDEPMTSRAPPTTGAKGGGAQQQLNQSLSLQASLDPALTPSPPSSPTAGGLGVGPYNKAAAAAAAAAAATNVKTPSQQARTSAYVTTTTQSSRHHRHGDLDPNKSKPPGIPPPAPPVPPAAAAAGKMGGATGGRSDFNHPMWSFANNQEGEEEDEMESESSIEVQAQLVDPEMSRLGGQLDVWCHDLKRNILAEFEQSRIRLIECQLAQFRDEREKRAEELRRAREEVSRFKELLSTYEQSIGRKDHIIANLTRTIQKQKERVDLQRTFSSWKLRNLNDKRQSFTTSLAVLHFNRLAKRRVWDAWSGVIRSRWKHRVEKACQRKAQEVCADLTDQYEEKLASVHKCLEDSQQEVVELKAQRDLYEDNMKKAFMRGVCALNLEAMTMFKYNDDASTTDGDHPGTPSKPPPPPPPQFVSEGSDAQRAQLAAHIQHKQAHNPSTVADMRPLRAEACLTPQAKSVHISTSTALDRATVVKVPSSPQAISMLASKVHHQHVLNRQGVEEPLYPGAGVSVGGIGAGGGGVKHQQCGRCVRGGTKPPAVFVQRHSERQVS